MKPFKIRKPLAPPLTVEETAKLYGISDEQLEEIKKFVKNWKGDLVPANGTET